MTCQLSVFATFIMPFALDGIGWKTYMVNASWDVLGVAFVVLWWVETRNRFLEEIDGIFETGMRFCSENILQGDEIQDAKTSYVQVHTLRPSNEARDDQEAGVLEKVVRSQN